MQYIKDTFFGKNLEQEKQEMLKLMAEKMKLDEIRILTRPVGSNINVVMEIATHVYLGYFEKDELVDSLSFDPNEGEGIRDPIGEWNNSYIVVTGDRMVLSKYWKEMKEVRQSYSESKYELLKWNCGHVAANLLDKCNVRKEHVKLFKTASEWAINVNKVANIKGKEVFEIYQDSKEKKDN